ncbi:hypothetical protein EF847_10440 [Actinobacteria bacterium YIM 96077]|uniref:Uncharacterized protein n=1 Tax=Phytoactinopolyspora halophila TaxID=1981511 RepID=A0A329QBX4_9ACTN|nr:hypothetical protein EF847_10440 [Actinobacteria bacterium YIM 96077]RAW09249.1 hypothetical protein DPM12_22180 [Phytoactinopolyspora halophila]
MEGKLYLCAIKDVCSGPDPRVLHRPLEPAQFRFRKFLRALARHCMVGSMGRVGAAGDNVAMDSFFLLLQNNVLNRRS